MGGGVGVGGGAGGGVDGWMEGGGGCYSTCGCFWMGRWVGWSLDDVGLLGRAE